MMQIKTAQGWNNLTPITQDVPAATKLAILEAHVHGYAVKGDDGRARTVIEFSGDAYNRWLAGGNAENVTGFVPEIAAFIDPATGAVKRDAMKRAAELLLAEKSR